MLAHFRNSDRGGLNEDSEHEPEAAAAAARTPRCRVVYASWHPDGSGLSVTWVEKFKECLEGFDDDKAEVALVSMVSKKPGEAGAKLWQEREDVIKALGSVTDFVVVATASYFLAQKKAQGQSELGWMIETVSDDAQVVVWVAAMHRLGFEGRSAGARKLSEFSKWHPTLGTDPLKPYTFPSDQDKRSCAEFDSEIDAAVDRIRAHCPECSYCPPPLR